MPHMEAKDKTVVSRVRLDLAKHFFQGCYEIRKIKALTHWLAVVGAHECHLLPSLPPKLPQGTKDPSFFSKFQDQRVNSTR